MREKRKASTHIAAICAVYFIVITCALSLTRAKADAMPSSETDIYANIDAYLQRCMQNAHIPAMSISIVNKNETLFSGNYGQCKSNETPFLLGSVSKSFTAACIMQLAQQQKIDLNARVADYLPDAADGDKIKVSQLLNHTSGLGEHQTLENCRIVNKQGEHHYANVNYSLLGEIIEAVSGKPYSAYISEHLFAPLGLSHTAADAAESVESGLIDGYTNYWGVPVKTAHKHPSSKNAWITAPAGYIASSSNDLGKYLQMYLNGGNGILSRESIDAMFYGDAVYVEDDVPYWYGYGWAMVKEPLSEPVLRHSGLVETGTSCVFLLPESGIGIAIETNVNDYFVTNEMMDSLGWGVVLMLLGDAPNEIADHAYIWRHFWLDLIMLLVLLAAILPLIFLPRYACNVRRRKKMLNRMLLAALHFLLPVFLLLLVPLFFATPLWVAKAFVPDVFLTIVISSGLLFIGGLVKGVILHKELFGNDF